MLRTVDGADGVRVLEGKAASIATLKRLLGPDYANELADLDAAAGVCAEILKVLRASVAGIEDRLERRVALRTDTYETELLAAARVVKTIPRVGASSQNAAPPAPQTLGSLPPPKRR